MISLGQLCRWLGDKAEELGVEIYPGFAADQVLYKNDGTTVGGVVLKDVGWKKDGTKKDSFEPGMEMHCKQLIV